MQAGVSLSSLESFFIAPLLTGEKEKEKKVEE